MGAVRRAVSSSEGVFEDDGAVAEYRLWKRPGNGNVVMEITHTFVPVDKRGCGLAGHVASAAFEFARQHDMRVLPTCTYIGQTFLERNPEYRSVCISIDDRLGLEEASIDDL